MGPNLGAKGRGRGRGRHARASPVKGRGVDRGRWNLRRKFVQVKRAARREAAPKGHVELSKSFVFADIVKWFIQVLFRPFIV